MVSTRVSCSLFIVLLILQLHAKGSEANSIAQEIVPQGAKSGEVLEAISSSINANKNVSDVMRSRKMLRGDTKEVETKKKKKKKKEIAEKNGLEVGKELVRRGRRNDQKEIKTESLTADYSNPLHHPPRHN